MNIIKARCPSCFSRASIIRTKPIDKTLSILTAQCDNEACQCVFQASLAFHQIVIPPVPENENPPEQQMTIFEGCCH